MWSSITPVADRQKGTSAVPKPSSGSVVIQANSSCPGIPIGNDESSNKNAGTQHNDEALNPGHRSSCMMSIVRVTAAQGGTTRESATCYRCLQVKREEPTPVSTDTSTFDNFAVTANQSRCT